MPQEFLPIQFSEIKSMDTGSMLNHFLGQGEIDEWSILIFLLGLCSKIRDGEMEEKEAVINFKAVLLKTEFAVDFDTVSKIIIEHTKEEEALKCGSSNHSNRKDQMLRLIERAYHRAS